MSEEEDSKLSLYYVIISVSAAIFNIEEKRLTLSEKALNEYFGSRKFAKLLKIVSGTQSIGSLMFISSFFVYFPHVKMWMRPMPILTLVITIFMSMHFVFGVLRTMAEHMEAI